MHRLGAELFILESELPQQNATIDKLTFAEQVCSLKYAEMQFLFRIV
jgi:hypothetical protein